jgi:hypothetical protein
MHHDQFFYFLLPLHLLPRPPFTRRAICSRVSRNCPPAPSRDILWSLSSRRASTTRRRRRQPRRRANRASEYEYDPKKSTRKIHEAMDCRRSIPLRRTGHIPRRTEQFFDIDDGAKHPHNEPGCSKTHLVTMAANF